MTSTPPRPGAHGGDGPAIAAWLGVAPESVLDLSASLNPFPPEIAPLLARHAAAAGRYADPGPLEVALAAHLGTDADRVVLTHGASGAIALLAQLLVRGRVDEPEFSLYRRHLQLDPDAPRWRSNPRSPTGHLADDSDRAGVWDEAYWQLATGTWTRGEHDRGAFTIGSLTKLFATPGLPAGYIVAPTADRAGALRALRPEWPVGAVTVDVMTDLIESVDLPSLARQIAASRLALSSVLDAHGLRVEAADAPWVLVHDAPHLRDQLAHQGVVVRDCGNFGLPSTVRIAVPDDAGLHRLTSALHPEDR